MAEPKLQHLIRSPASIYADPTDPDSLDPADWGIPLGMHENVAVTLEVVQELYTNLITGRPSQQIHDKETLSASMLLRTFDYDALGMLFPEILTLQTKSGLPKIASRTDQLSGSKLTDRGRVLLIKPTEPDSHPGLYLYNAVANLSGDPQQFQVEVTWGMVIVFIAFPDEDGNVFDYCRLQDVA